VTDDGPAVIRTDDCLGPPSQGGDEDGAARGTGGHRRAHIYGIEAGQRNPTVVVVKLAHALNTTASVVLRSWN
jgi:hypothetical protein